MISMTDVRFITSKTLRIDTFLSFLMFNLFNSKKIKPSDMML